MASWRRRWLLVEYVLLHMVQRCLPETVDVRGDGMCCVSALALGSQCGFYSAAAIASEFISCRSIVCGPIGCISECPVPCRCDKKDESSKPRRLSRLPNEPREDEVLHEAHRQQSLLPGQRYYFFHAYAVCSELESASGFIAGLRKLSKFKCKALSSVASCRSSVSVLSSDFCLSFISRWPTKL